MLALLSDSTNATVPGRTPSERAVIPAFEEIFAEAAGRIIVAAFASSIHRLQIVLDVAQQFNRKVCVLGRSMQKNVEIADRLGYLDIPDGLLVSLNETKQMHAIPDCVSRYRFAGRVARRALADGDAELQRTDRSKKATRSCFRRASFPAMSV